MWRSVKTWGHDVGLSCAFRQWRADSHCQKIHGYALSVSVAFEADKLDGRGWVIDFGGLKELKQSLVDTFDHKTVVAQDDPHISWFREAHRLNLLDLVVLPDVGCECFAHHVWRLADHWLHTTGQGDRVRVASVTIAEHGANAAVFCP